MAVGLQPLEDLLTVVQHSSGRDHVKRAIRFDDLVVPACLDGPSGVRLIALSE